MTTILSLIALWALFEPRSFGEWVGSIRAHAERGFRKEVIEGRDERSAGEVAWGVLGAAFAIFTLIAAYGAGK